jgi:hypothetical protein
MKQPLKIVAASLLLTACTFLTNCQKSSQENLPVPATTSGASVAKDTNVMCTTVTQTISYGGQVQLVYTTKSCSSGSGVFQFPDYPTAWSGVDGRETPGCCGALNPPYEHISTELDLTSGAAPTEPQNYNCVQQRSAPEAIRTIDTFVMDNYGNTRNACVTQRGWYDLFYQQTVQLPKGPTVRYVRDPLNRNLVIDMQRMLVMGNWGLTTATSNEIVFYLLYDANNPNYTYNKYNDRDFFSLQLGVDFYTNYASQLATNPTNFAELVSEFLKDPAQRTTYTDGSKCR